MTEKEKCHKGLLYDANYDEELLRERAVCKDLCYEYNSLRPSMIAERTEIIRRLFGKIFIATMAITSKLVRTSI